MLRSPFTQPVAARRFTMVCAAIALLGGTITLVGWFTGSPRLTDWVGMGLHMMPNTALGICLTALVLWLRAADRNLGSRSIAVVAGAIGLASLAENILDIDLGIDELVVQAAWGQHGTTAPGRMGVPASLIFVLLNTSIILSTMGRLARTVATAGAGFCIAISMFSVIGYLYGADAFYLVPGATAIAINTAILLTLLSVGLITALPEAEPMRTIIEPSATGALVRRALPVLLLLPVILGWIRLQGEYAGWYDLTTGTAARTILEMFLMGGILWWMAAAVRMHERLHSSSVEALNRSEQRYHAFVQQSTEGIWRCELRKPMDVTLSTEAAVDWAYEHGYMAECNDAMARMYGYEHGEELIGTALVDLLPRTPENLAYLRAFMSSGYRLEGGESEERDKDGAMLHFNNNLVGIVENGFLVRAWGTQQNITERKQVQEALRESERMLSLIYHNTSDALYLVEVVGDGPLRVLSANRTLLELTGYTEEEVLGRPLQQVLSGDSFDRVERAVQDSIGTRGPVLYQEDIELPAGHRHARITVVPIYEPGDPVTNLLVSITDLTEQHQAQVALHAADRRKNEFIATLAHELRNPLAPMRSGLELLSEDAADDPETIEIHKMMHRQMGQLVKLVDDLMDVSRISRDAIPLRMEPVPISDVLHLSVEAITPAIKQRQQTLTVEPGGDDNWVLGDRTRLVQAISNLLGNASKYTDAQGTIHLSTWSTAEEVLIRISDTGIGIPADMLPNVFDLFSQVDRHLDRTQGGLGIGLSIVRKLVSMHQGNVEAHSDGEGKGSSFTVRLPRIAAPGGLDEQPGTDARVQRARRILVVDDDRDVAGSMALLLQRMGQQCFTANSGAEALGTIEDISPELVLMDIGMPGMNGYETCRAIRKRMGPDLRIIAVSGWGQAEDQRRSTEAGFDGHLVKPVSKETLITLL